MLTLLSLVCGPALAHGTQTGTSDQHYLRSTHDYPIPDVTLRDRNDHPVALTTLLGANQPIVLQFIFTSCETICPMLTAMTAQAQTGLRGIDASTRIVSISIDPDYDTPRRMADYANKFGAKGDWRFLTGDWSNILKVLNAFNAMYAGQNKMNHKPYTFMRRAHSKIWIRLVGLMPAKQMATEYRHTLE